MKKVFQVATGIGSLLLVLYFAIWGVPSYIDNRVASGVQAEIARINKLSGTPEEVTILIAKMESVEGGLLLLNGTVVRVEQKVDDFSRLFTGYLERQAR